MEQATSKILIVDSSQRTRQQMADLLKEAGYIFEEAADGQVAWEKVAVQHYDLIISEVDLAPSFTARDYISGLDLLTRVREKSLNARIPFLFLTGDGSESMKRAAIERGATGRLIKPFDPGKFIDVVRDVLRPDSGYQVSVPVRPLLPESRRLLRGLGTA